jgi:hypothetical protein
LADLPYYLFQVTAPWVLLKSDFSADKIIRDNLGEITLKKIETRLLERYNLTVNQGLLEFAKFDSVLREFFGSGAEGLEKKILKVTSHK